MQGSGDPHLGLVLGKASSLHAGALVSPRFLSSTSPLRRHRHRHSIRSLTVIHQHVCPRSERSLAAHPDRAHATDTEIWWRRRTAQGRFRWTRSSRRARNWCISREQCALQRSVISKEASRCYLEPDYDGTMLIEVQWTEATGQSSTPG